MTQTYEKAVGQPSTDFATAREHPDWNTAPLWQLIDHIVHQHHSWLRQEMALIQQMMERVIDARGTKRRDSILPLQRVFAELRNETLEHLLLEEQVLFPAITRMESDTDSLGYPIPMMEHNHDAAARYLDEIRDLTHGYYLPENACDSFRTLYEELQALEADMRTHLHLENNILFPRAARLERKMAYLRRPENILCLTPDTAHSHR